MMRTYGLVLLALLGVIRSAPIVAEESSTPAPLETATAMVANMAAEEFEQVTKPFDDVMRKRLSHEKLAEVWAEITAQFGPYAGMDGHRTEMVDKYVVIFITTKFQLGQLEAKVVIDPATNQVSGFFLLPAPYKSPSYVDREKFTEQQLRIGTGFLKLPATLTLPSGEGPFAGVVLVHGSGPHDQDESIGPNKPFKDIAEGLASNGVAVLRYTKRTKEHPLAMALLQSSITVKQETVDDAVAAVDALLEHEKIDSEQVFVLGHSLGGTLLPRIAQERDEIAGLISLAGSVRALEDLVLEQTEYLVNLDGKLTAEEQQQLKTLKQQVERVRSEDLSTRTPVSELPLGVPASYWLDLRGYNPAESAQKLPQRMLFLQGERDYQVTMKDFELWRTSLAHRPDMKFISYPTLNHLFTTGTQRSTPTEYFSPGNVAEQVVQDIAAWVKDEE